MEASERRRRCSPAKYMTYWFPGEFRLISNPQELKKLKKAHKFPSPRQPRRTSGLIFIAIVFLLNYGSMCTLSSFINFR